MKYAILNQTTREDGQTIYEVILEADDGYQETQTYVGQTEQVLTDAVEHFNTERAKLVASQQAQLEGQISAPQFVNVD